MPPQMVKGDSGKRMSYLIRTGRFICVNGFNRLTLSAKRRALHHCYAYMRIMAETTSIVEDVNIDLIGVGVALNDHLACEKEFRILPNIEVSDSTMSMEKDPEMAQRDLHLAIPGRWNLTLFPKVYGVAETFLMLLSQVVRLANERDLNLMSYGAGRRVLNLRDFWMRAKALEKRINVLLSSGFTEHVQNFEDEVALELTNSIARAMYTALSIFFYRRIYDINAIMLQQEVDVVRVCLTQIRQEEDYRNGVITAALIWPAFVTACESVDPESQLFFSSWFDSCFKATGLVNVAVAKQIVEMIWSRRNEAGLHGELFSWPEILRTERIRFICT